MYFDIIKKIIYQLVLVHEFNQSRGGPKVLMFTVTTVGRFTACTTPRIRVVHVKRSGLKQLPK